jgi:hypothetical protein
MELINNQRWLGKNKVWLALIGLSIILLVIKIINYNKPAQFFSDIPLLLLPMIIFIRFRKQIGISIKKIPFPKFLLYLLSSVPFIIFEENINCLQTGCRVIPSTLPFLLTFVLILGLAVRFFRTKNIALPIIIFSILGLVFELTLGASRVQLHAMLFSPTGILISIWTAISYAFFVIIPLTILTEV